ncbi:Hypp9413 [Branchiostoma lanceolatum]|uniref:Hypp9413 protein n=1 Tax=Branchiostoma lanceolatum TaxID=7740 RepID=A0A8S4MN62_BRALA|nr:Hypp9413 [Branchiostoma lanceolatum]
MLAREAQVSRLQALTALGTVDHLQALTALGTVDHLQALTALGTVDHLQALTALGTVDHLQALTALGTVDHLQALTALGTVDHLQALTALGTVDHLQALTALGTLYIAETKKSLRCRLDTGAHVNVLPEKDWRRLRDRNTALKPTETGLYGYGNTWLDVLGECSLPCRHRVKQRVIAIYPEVLHACTGDRRFHRDEMKRSVSSITRSIYFLHADSDTPGWERPQEYPRRKKSKMEIIGDLRKGPTNLLEELALQMKLKQLTMLKELLGAFTRSQGPHPRGGASSSQD